VGEPAVTQRLDDRQVGVGQADVLADDRDGHLVAGRVDPRDDAFPVGQVRGDLRQAEPAATTSSSPSSRMASGTS
jgi:hypothetical protein